MIELAHRDDRAVELTQYRQHSVDGSIAVAAVISQVLQVLEYIARGHLIRRSIGMLQAKPRAELHERGLVGGERQRPQSARDTVRADVETQVS